MKILNLEHFEIISQSTRNETTNKICGGFVFVRTEAFGYASGSIAAITSVSTKTFTVNYPIFVPPVF